VSASIVHSWRILLASERLLVQLNLALRPETAADNPLSNLRGVPVENNQYIHMRRSAQRMPQVHECTVFRLSTLLGAGTPIRVSVISGVNF